jgi:streptomycin 6-kinase
LRYPDPRSSATNLATTTGVNSHASNRLARQPRAQPRLWADWFEPEFERDGQGLDPGLARDGMAILRALRRSADRTVLLCTDLHAGNVLSARREPWLVIDPKPFVGDPAFEPVQHM